MSRHIPIVQNLEVLNKDRFPFPYMEQTCYECDRKFIGTVATLTVERGERYDRDRLESAGVTPEAVRPFLAVGATETACSRLYCHYILWKETEKYFGRIPSDLERYYVHPFQIQNHHY